MAPEPRSIAGGANLRRAREFLGVGFPPVRRRSFWAVQLLVLAIAAAHTLVELVVQFKLPAPLYLVPTSLFFVPVVYAALRFGTRGSVTTALWSFILTLPNIVLLHEGLVRVGIAWQFGILLALALFVGARVDLERQAHREADARRLEVLASEERFRALFDNAAESVLVLDDAGVVEDANDAALRLLGRPDHDLVGATLRDAVGAAIAVAVASGGERQTPVLLPGAGAAPARWIEPLVSGPLIGPDGREHTQLMLHDVTLRQERQQGLERYARRTVTAREEERRRIGRELHDGPLQALVLVGRKLDQLSDAADDDRTAAEARAILDDTAAEVRRISRALRPSILDDLGLVPAIRSEVAALARRSAIEARFSSPSTIEASAEVELMLLRVAQEALHNIERHAGATRVAVRLMLQGEGLRLVVRDDGRGPGRLPSAAELLAAGRLGLVGMEERARLSGGDFAIRAARPRGTIVCVEAPLRLPPREDGPDGAPEA
ncbi:MAG: PAS domain-containing protein [Chloroflexota bacterium]|nr:PAS domain-containing protein [Chloroflexota bacterium]